MASLTIKELEALRKHNVGLSRSMREFDDDGNCTYSLGLNREDASYTTDADVSGKRMRVIICDDCGASVPLFEVS